MNHHRLRYLGLAMLLIAGCSSRDDRLARFAAEANSRQAEQNRQMADLQQTVADGSRKLVDAEAASRAEFTQLQQQLQTQQSELDQQREALEHERQRIADQRHRDPIIAAAIETAALIFACLLPLVLCWYLLRQEDRESADALVAEVLLTDLVAIEPILLRKPTVHLEHHLTAQQTRLQVPVQLSILILFPSPWSPFPVTPMSHIVEIQTEIRDPVALPTAPVTGAGSGNRKALFQRSDWLYGAFAPVAVPCRLRSCRWQSGLRQLRRPLGRAATPRCTAAKLCH